MTQLIAQDIRRAGHWQGAAARCLLTYDERFLRRKVITADDLGQVLVDLPKTQSLNHGDAFVLSDGRFIEVFAAKEKLFKVTGDLPFLAWHIGNRHTPCQISAECLFIQQDRVIGEMLHALGADVEEVVSGFSPVGGAYGHGRTHSHHHGDHDAT